MDNPKIISKYRLLWIDYIKGICMFIVILSHISKNDIFNNLFYQWFLVGFFFVAGYTFSIKNSFLQFIIGKFKRLVIPVFLFGILNLILALFSKEFSILERLKGIFLQIPGEFDDMWFVACLFTMQLLFYPIIRWVKVDLLIFSICILYISIGIILKNFFQTGLPWHIVNALLTTIFLEVGYLTKKHNIIGRIKVKLSNKKNILYCLLILSFVYIFLSLILNNYGIDIHVLIYGEMWKFYLLAFLGLSNICILTILLEYFSNNIFCRFLQFIGINSLSYYGLQSKVISCVTLLVLSAGLTPSSIPTSLFMTFIVSIILLPFAYIIKEWFPFLLGNTHIFKSHKNYKMN